MCVWGHLYASCNIATALACSSLNLTCLADGRALPSYGVDPERWAEAERLTQAQWIDHVLGALCELDLVGVDTHLERFVTTT